MKVNICKKSVTKNIHIHIYISDGDDTGFKKPGAKSGLSIRTPFKDRSVNSVSPTSKFNSKLSMQKKSEEAVMKNVSKNVISMKSQQKKDENDFYVNDFASYKEVEGELRIGIYVCVYHFKTFDDVVQCLDSIVCYLPIVLSVSYLSKDYSYIFSDSYADIFPTQRFDVVQMLRDYVSREAYPKFTSDDEMDDDIMELAVSEIHTDYSLLPSPIRIHDVSLPLFDF